MTTARAKILWVDDDPALVYPLRIALEEAGYEVAFAKTLSSASELLRSGSYNLVILDVMMPLTAEDESQAYSPGSTDCGANSGLAFYRRHRDNLIARQVLVLVMTVRMDRAIADAFAAAGLPRHMVVSKVAIRNVVSFLEKIRAVLVERSGDSGA